MVEAGGGCGSAREDKVGGENVLQCNAIEDADPSEREIRGQRPAPG